MNLARAVGYSEAGRRIYEAGLKFQRENPHAEETPAQRRDRLVKEAHAEEASRYEAAAAEARAAHEAEIIRKREARAAVRAAALHAAITARVQAALDNALAPPKVVDVVEATMYHFGTSRSALMSPRRSKFVVRPRQVAMFLAKELTNASLPEIGRRLGGKDHTTILHGCRKIASLIESGDPIAKDVRAIRSMLIGSEEPVA